MVGLDEISFWDERLNTIVPGVQPSVSRFSSVPSNTGVPWPWDRGKHPLVWLWLEMVGLHLGFVLVDFFFGGVCLRWEKNNNQPPGFFLYLLVEWFLVVEKVWFVGGWLVKKEQ